MFRIKKSLLLLCCLATAILSVSPLWAHAKVDGGSIIIKEANAHSGYDKSSTIDASIDGHSLTVTFTENLGTVQVDVTTALGDRVEYTPIWTPDSFTTYIASTGSYVVTITPPNGDEYYGEFEVTD